MDLAATIDNVYNTRLAGIGYVVSRNEKGTGTLSWRAGDGEPKWGGGALLSVRSMVRWARTYS